MRLTTTGLSVAGDHAVVEALNWAAVHSLVSCSEEFRNDLYEKLMVVDQPKIRQSHGFVYSNGEEVAGRVEPKPYDRIELGQNTQVFVPFCGPQFMWRAPG